MKEFKGSCQHIVEIMGIARSYAEDVGQESCAANVANGTILFVGQRISASNTFDSELSKMIIMLYVVTGKKE